MYMMIKEFTREETFTKMSKIQNTIAIICDCDETLAPDTTSYLLKENGIDVNSFWNKMTKLVSEGWDPSLVWLGTVVELIKSGKISQDTNKKLKQFGKKLPLYNGVPEFIPEIKSMVRKNRDFVRAGVTVEFFIISSGLEDLIKGSKLSREFTDIFASTFAEDSKTGKISSIKSAVSFTEKTKFLYAINKGITGKDLKKYPYGVNDAIKRVDRRIPFEYMIYLGDSPGDIPCFSMIRGYGGNCIGIIGKKTVHKGFELARGKRTTVGPYSRNYKKESDLRLVLDTIVKKIGYEIVDNIKTKQS